MSVYECKYLHETPLCAGDYRSYNKIPMVRQLLVEVNNICPLCKHKIQEDVSNESKYIGNIAHIYARKNFFKKKKLINKNMFPNLYHIKSKEELDELHNLILLCKFCHDEYDKTENITYESYLKILNLKKNIVYNMSEADKLYQVALQLIEKIPSIKEKTSNSLFEVDETEARLIKKKLVKKFQINDFDIKQFDGIYLDQIINQTIGNIIKYYSLLDEFDIFSDTIIKDIGRIYRNLVEVNPNKEHVLNLMLNIMKQPYNDENDKYYSAIISYCIMKCEVLENE